MFKMVIVYVLIVKRNVIKVVFVLYFYIVIIVGFTRENVLLDVKTGE